MLTEHGGAAIVLAGFVAVVGATIGFVVGGGGRYGGERAVSQPGAAGHDLAVVAAFLDDEDTATDLARVVASSRQQFDIRIVGIDGRWRVPNT